MLLSYFDKLCFYLHLAKSLKYLSLDILAVRISPLIISTSILEYAGITMGREIPFLTYDLCDPSCRWNVKPSFWKMLSRVFQFAGVRRGMKNDVEVLS